jgi:hypothetical protein
MSLQENLGGEAGKGVLTGGGASAAMRMPMGRRHRWGAKGVVEAVGEVVGEELLSGTELAAGWGNNRRRLPSMRCSQRKTTTGESCFPTSLAGAAGRFLVQEGWGDGALLLVRSDNSKVVHRRLVMAGEAVAGAEQSNEECSWTVEGGSEVGGCFLGDVWSTDKGGSNPRGATTTGGHRRWAALHVVSVATGNRAARGIGWPSRAVKMETGRW